MTSLKRCACSMMPSNVKIIRVGDSNVGLVDLEKSFREIYFLKIEDEAALRARLLERVKTNNYIPPEKENLFAEALWREYHSFVERRYSPKKTSLQQSQQATSGFPGFLGKLAGAKGRKK